MLRFLIKKFSWFEWVNITKDHSKIFTYTFLMLDDFFFLTKNLDEIFINEFKSINNLGVACFIDDAYKDGHYHPQLRGAFHIDRLKFDATTLGIDYEYHNQKPGWFNRTYKLKKFLNFFQIIIKLYLINFLNYF